MSPQLHHLSRQPQSAKLQTRRRIVPTENRKRALFSCDRCKLRKTKCKRIQNNDLKYDNITPCAQCSKAGVSCTTSIPRKKRFYGPIENITLHYKCLLALVTGLFPDKDVYNIEELMELGKSFKFEMPSLDSTDEDISSGLKSLADAAAEADEIPAAVQQNELNNQDVGNEEEEESDKEGINAKKPKVENVSIPPSSSSNETASAASNPATTIIPENKAFTTSQLPPKLPPYIKIKANSNYDSEKLIMDRFGHTHFIGNFGTASLLNGLCDIIIKRSYNLKPPTSTQDIRDASVQTITSENEPVYQYPTHLYNLDTINVNRFPLINLLKRKEADGYMRVFFEKVHPYYFIFNKFKFRERYEIFWEEISNTAEGSTKEESNSNRIPMKIGSSEICCVYMVWILGRRFQQYSDPQELPKGAELDNELIARYIDIIKLSLSDIVLTPNLDGIRLLILFSVYLSSIKVRESGYCLMQMAAIQSKSLGLHRRLIVDKFNDEKSDEMKRVMWSLTKAETILCCSFGRASAIPWEEIDIDLPLLKDEENDELFRIYYFQSCRLTKIIFQILDNKKKSQKEPLSLTSIEKSLLFQKKLEDFWEKLPVEWKNYKSLPVRRYKPKLHIQYHYYFITLTLPMFLHIVNIQNFTITKDDPIMSLLVNGIKSSIRTAEIVTYTDSNGFFNGTLYYDIFYSYNAIMVLTLTYILLKSSSKDSKKFKTMVDLEYLDKEHNINLSSLLSAINLIRKLILNNLFKIDGTMRRISDIIETLLEDLGIIQVLVKDYNAKPSNVKKIEDRNESGKTSVNGGIPGYYRKLKMNITNNANTGSGITDESSNKLKRKRSSATGLKSQTPPPPISASKWSNNLARKSKTEEPENTQRFSAISNNTSTIDLSSTIQPIPQGSSQPSTASQSNFAPLHKQQQQLSQQPATTDVTDIQRNYSSLFQNFPKSRNSSESNLQNLDDNPKESFSAQRHQLSSDNLMLNFQSSQSQPLLTESQLQSGVESSSNLQFSNNVDGGSHSNGGQNVDSVPSTPSSSSLNINDALSSLLDTELMDVLFGEDNLLSGVVNAGNGVINGQQQHQQQTDGNGGSMRGGYDESNWS